jgi:hypothetical protein
MFLLKWKRILHYREHWEGRYRTACIAANDYTQLPEHAASDPRFAGKAPAKLTGCNPSLSLLF